MADNYKIESMYTGGYSSIDPNKSYFSGYRVPAGQLSVSTNPQVAAIVKEVSEKLNLGLKRIELAPVIPKVFDSIPQEQLKEVHRLAQLTGTKVSMHGLIIEPSGLGQNGYSDSERASIERQVYQNLIRAHDANPNGITVNFHTSNALPSEEISVDEKGNVVQKGTLVINTETGGFQKLPLKERFFPGEEKKIDVKTEIALQNEEAWSQQLRHLAYYRDVGKEQLGNAAPLAFGAEAEEKAGNELLPAEEQGKKLMSRAGAYLNDSYREVKSLYDLASRKANATGNQADKKILQELYKKIEEDALKINKAPKSNVSFALRQKIIDESLDAFEKISPPELIQRADEFMMGKSAETFGNAAFKALKYFSDQGKENETPMVILENPPANQQFSTGEDVAKMVQESRNVFVKNAIKSTSEGGLGISESEAKQKADKLIGATLDVGHLNMLRQKGYSDEKIVEEAGKFAPYLKHVHLSDNFGMEHTELPMGMGNVPFKQIMEKLGKKGSDLNVDKVIEAADWWTQHTTKGAGTPIGPSLEGMSSPMYSTGVGQYWDHAGKLAQGYFGGFGMMLPQTNYNMFGAGFSQLPMELGGNIPQAGGSRTTGRPME